MIDLISHFPHVINLPDDLQVIKDVKADAESELVYGFISPHVCPIIKAVWSKSFYYTDRLSINLFEIPTFSVGYTLLPDIPVIGSLDLLIYASV